MIERACDANERPRVDENNPSQIDSNDRGSDWDLCDQRFGARRREVGKQTSDIHRGAVLMRLESNLAEFHATLQQYGALSSTASITRTSRGASRPRHGLRRKDYRDGRSVSDDAPGADGSTVRFHEMSHDREAESGAAFVA